MTTFGRQAIYVDNPGAPQPPTASDDINAGYGPGSRWYDTRYNAYWSCVDATAGAAKWVPIMAGQYLAKALGVNANVVGDTTMVPYFDVTQLNFGIAKIVLTNASESMTTAKAGVFTGAGATGTTIVANQTISPLTTVTSLMTLTLGAGGTGSVFSVAPIINVSTAQGTAGTFDAYLIGDIIPKG